MRSSVVFPEPFGPVTTAKPPPRTVEVDVAEHPLRAVAPAELSSLDHRGQSRPGEYDRGSVTMEGITVEELQLAARNHALPLEALREPITPVGLHYLLIHFDIPQVDAAQWELRVGGLVERPLALDLEELRCAAGADARGHARMRGQRPGALLAAARRASRGCWRQSARPSGRARRSRRSSREAGLADGASEVVFTGLDRGVQGGVEHVYERSLSLEDALRDEVLLAYEVNGAAAAAAARLSAAPDRPGLVRDDAREVAQRDHRRRRRLSRLAASRGVPVAAHRGRRGNARDAHAAALAARAAGRSGVPVARALPRGGAVRRGGTRVVGLGRRSSGSR